MKPHQIGIIVVLFLLAVLPASAQPAVVKVTSHFTDVTNTVDFQEWQVLDKLLKSFEDSASTQIVVLMIPTVGENSIEEYAQKAFELNKIGQAKKNNGVLLLIAKDDHKMRIEVGYGLEGVLTDAISSHIIRNEIEPKFQQGNYFAGIASGIDGIMRATAGEYKMEKQANKAPSTAAGLLFVLAIIGYFVFSFFIGGRRRWVGGLGNSMYYSGWGYRGGSWGGGSFGGGGFGGFSGGGGMSGGGGASGSW